MGDMYIERVEWGMCIDMYFLEIILTERLTSVEYEEINFTDFNFLNFV